MVGALVSAVLQLGVVLLVAAIAWLAMRRPQPFRSFVGILPAPVTVVAACFAAGAILAFLMTRVPAISELGRGEGTVVGEGAGGGLSAAVAVSLAIRALLQTSLTEELFFRGLIGRNLIRRWGFAAGNSVQAVLFGLVHLLLLLSPDSTLAAVAALVLITGIAGWVLGWVNDRFASGSILPGWGAHGGANLAAYLLLAA